MNTRREFLRTLTFAAGAGPMIVRAATVGRDGATAPSGRITIGMIGMGRQASHANLPGFLYKPDAQVVAVCDVDSWRMGEGVKKVNQYYTEKQGATYKGCATHRDFREVLARKDIDAVMISTPDHWHVPMSVAAIKAGKDVSCEKPLTRNVAEGRLLADLVAKEKRVFRTDSEFRFNRKCHQAATLVRNGKIGKLKTIRVTTPPDTGGVGQPAPMPVPEELDYEMWLGPAPQAPYTLNRVHPRNETKGRPGWIRLRDYADGMIANWGAHLLDICMWANDTERTGPIEVSGTGEYPPVGELWNVILKFNVAYTFANGVQLTVAVDKPRIRFEGVEGWVETRYPSEISASNESLLKWKPGPNDLSFPFHDEKRDFLDTIKSRGRTQTDAEAGHRLNSMSHLAEAAIAVGKLLKWDPVAERFTNSDEANQLLRPKPMRAPWSLWPA